MTRAEVWKRQAGGALPRSRPSLLPVLGLDVNAVLVVYVAHVAHGLVVELGAVGVIEAQRDGPAAVVLGREVR